MQNRSSDTLQRRHAPLPVIVLVKKIACTGSTDFTIIVISSVAILQDLSCFSRFFDPFQDCQIFIENYKIFRRKKLTLSVDVVCNGLFKKLANTETSQG